MPFETELVVDIRVGVPGHTWELSMMRVELINVYGKANRKPPEPARVSVYGKFCATCDRDLPLIAGFHKCKASPDGRDRQCKRCKKEYDRGRTK